MLAQVPLVWLFGPALWYGRLISLLSVAAVALFVGLTLHALTKDRIAAIAGGLIFPAMPYVVRWSSLSRVDSLGLALSWAGLFVVAAAQARVGGDHCRVEGHRGVREQLRDLRRSSMPATG